MQLALLIFVSMGFILTLCSSIISVIALEKLTSISDKQLKLDSDSERIKHASQRIQSQLEVVLNELNNVNNDMDDMGMPSNILTDGKNRVFRSLDGKHEAETFEKLMEKMRQDPNYQNMQQIEEDDEDEEDKPWKSK